MGGLFVYVFTWVVVSILLISPLFGKRSILTMILQRRWTHLLVICKEDQTSTEFEHPNCKVISSLPREMTFNRKNKQIRRNLKHKPQVSHVLCKMMICLWKQFKFVPLLQRNFLFRRLEWVSYFSIVPGWLWVENTNLYPTCYGFLGPKHLPFYPQGPLDPLRKPIN